MKIPFVDLHAQYLSIRPEIDNAIAEVIANTAFIGGQFVRKFESDFSSLLGVEHTISCANGTDSLYIMLRMLGIGVGDEVVTVANSWISSSETIGQTGALPVFVDVTSDYYSIDENLFEAAITERTKAAVIVHLQGQPCEMQTIQEICDRRGITLLEDCAQSHLTEYKGQTVGTFGFAASFSFYPGKNLGAYGDAGCIVTNDAAFADKCRMFANHGALLKHQHKIEGINSRLDGLQAAILSAKMPYLNEWTQSRISNADLYNTHLKGIEEIILPIVRPDCKHTFHLYVIRVKNREKLSHYLKANGIDTAVHYPLALPNQECYKSRNLYGKFPVATELQDEILSLPMYPELTESQIEYIADKIRSFYK